jgi:hypothetical protein
MKDMISAYKILVGKPELKRPLGRPRCRWKVTLVEWILEKYGRKLWTGCIWLIVETSGGLL